MAELTKGEAEAVWNLHRRDYTPGQIACILRIPTRQVRMVLDIYENAAAAAKAALLSILEVEE